MISVTAILQKKKLKQREFKLLMRLRLMYQTEPTYFDARLLISESLGFAVF